MKKSLWPVAIIALAVVLSFSMGMFKSEPQKIASPDTSVAVETIVPIKTNVDIWVHSQGTVAARTRTSLVSEVAGTVLGVSKRFAVGGVFKRNDVIMWLDPTDYEVAVQRANAELASRKAQLALEEARATQAQAEWAQTGQSADKAPILALRLPYLDEARANVSRANAELKQAQRKLDRTKIRAPFAGRVSAKSVDVGHYVSVGGLLGEMFAIDKAEIRLPLTDKDLAQLAAPASLTRDSTLKISPRVILTSSVGDKPHQWAARIVRSEGVVDPQNRVHYLVAEVEDPYGILSGKETQPLLVGSFVTAKIQGKHMANVYAIPRAAIREGQQVALVDEEMRLRFRRVNIDYSDDEFVYADHGIDEGIEVITSAMGMPINGMRVKPIQAPVEMAVSVAPNGRGAEQ